MLCLPIQCDEFECECVGWEQVWGGGYIQPITINDTAVVLTEEEMNNAEDAAKAALLAAEDSDDEEGLNGDEDVDTPAPEGTIYDNVEQTVTVLRGFWLAHSEQLKNIPIQYIDVIKKYDPTLKKFAEAHVRVTSMAGREGMDFLDVRAVVEDDDHDDELDELDECVLDSFNYTPSFRRKYFCNLSFLSLCLSFQMIPILVCHLSFI